jgi:hypothetical protein
VRVVVSVVDRDAAALGICHDFGPDLLDPLACALEQAGLCFTDCRQATAADVAALGSTWAKRLGIPTRRPAWLLTAQKPRPGRYPDGEAYGTARRITPGAP